MKLKTFLFALMSILTLNVFSQTNNFIEGKWVIEDYPNTMYILENGQRYTYYCLNGNNCDSLFNTYEAGDGNHMPEIHNYTFINDTLTVDLNFGNFYTEEVEFQCDSNIINFPNSEVSRWVRLNTNVDDCNSTGVNDIMTNNVKVWPNPVSGMINVSTPSNNGNIKIMSVDGRCVYQNKYTTTLSTIDSEILSQGTYVILINDDSGKLYTTKIVK